MRLSCELLTPAVLSEAPHAPARGFLIRMAETYTPYGLNPPRGHNRAGFITPTRVQGIPWYSVEARSLEMPKKTC